MRRFLLALVVIGGPWCPAHAQKSGVNGNTILADSVEYARFEKDGCGAFDGECQYYIESLSGKRLFVVKTMKLNDPAERTAANKDGLVPYTQFVFSKSGARAEVPYIGALGMRPKDVAKAVVKARLLKDGELDNDAVQEFVNNNGTPYSDRRKALEGPKVILIEN